MREVPARRKRTPPDPARSQDLAASIAEAAAQQASAARAVAEAEHRYAETMLAAYREGMSWAAIAAAAGLASGDQARVRAERAMSDDEISPSRRRRTSSRPRPSAPGVSVAEAARTLGVARSTIYDRIDRGELTSTVDALGRTRVLLPH